MAKECAWYVEQGSSVALLVDPEEFSITAFSPGQEQTLRGGEMVPLEAVLPGLELSVDEVFTALA